MKESGIFFLEFTKNLPALISATKYPLKAIFHSIFRTATYFPTLYVLIECLLDSKFEICDEMLTDFKA